MSEVLGFGINVYKNYEKGEVPNQSNATLLKLIQSPAEFKKVLEMSRAIKTSQSGPSKPATCFDCAMQV